MENNLEKQFELLSGLVTGEETVDEVHEYFKNTFKLPGNPFPPSGIADITEENPPLDPKIAENLLHFIRRSYKDRQLHTLVITGEYGTGKTHTLRFVEYVINTYMSKGDNSARAIYVERPRLEVNELNRTILRKLGLDTVRKYIWFALRHTIIEEITSDAESFQAFRNELTLPKQKSGFEPRLWSEEKAPIPKQFTDVFDPDKLDDYRTFLKNFEKSGWNREKIRYYLVDCLVKSIGEDVSIDLAQTFIALLLAQDEKSFSSWESLVSVSNPKATSSLRAPNFLEFLLRIMHRNGIVYVYLLLDEFEEVPEGKLLSAKQRQDYLYTLREVFDKLKEGLAIAIAITPGGLAALTTVATPLADRTTQVSLPPLEINDALKLVQFYFDDERKGSSFEVEVGKIEPLSENIIKYVLDNFPINVQRTPRNLIQFLYILLDHSQENKISEFSEEMLQNLIEQFSAMKPSGAQNSRRRK